MLHRASISFHQSKILASAAQFKISMKFIAHYATVFPRGKNGKKLLRVQRSPRRENPLLQIRRIITQTPATQINRRVRVIIDFNPILIIPVLVHYRPIIGRNKFQNPNFRREHRRSQNPSREQESVQPFC